MTVQFGLRVPTVGKPQDTGAYAAEVEEAGFDFMWTPDTPLLAGQWRDVYLHLGCAGLQTRDLRLGPGVTNPLTRHPISTASSILSLDDLTDGRAELLVGTGYSSAYIIGRKAATLANMRESTLLWRSIFSGESTQLGGLEINLDLPRPRLPIYLAASGPKMLELAGEIADGVLIMVGTAPGTVAWALEHVEAGIKRAGRDPKAVRKMLVVTACVDAERPRAIARMRPCAASLYRHRDAETLLSRAGLSMPASIPAQRSVYPDMHHAVDWEAAKAACAFVPDEAVEALVALGSAEEVVEQAKALMALGADALWFRDEGSYTRPDALRESLANDVLPKLR